MVTVLLIIITGLITFTTSGDFFQEGTKRLTKKGWSVSILIFLSIVFGIIDKKSSNAEAERLLSENQNLQVKSDSLQSNLHLFREHFDLKSQISLSQNELLQLTADSLKLRLESLSERNELNKKEREIESLKLRKQIDKLNGQLQLAQKTIKDNVESSRPQVDVCEPVKWGKKTPEDSLYNVYILTCNTGKRTAENFKMRTCLINRKKDSLTPILVHEYPIDLHSDVAALPPKSETGYLFSRTIGPLTKEELKSADHDVILYLEFRYVDPSTQKEIVSNRCYSWKGYDKDYLNFNTASQEELSLAKTYFDRL